MEEIFPGDFVDEGSLEHQGARGAVGGVVVEPGLQVGWQPLEVGLAL